MTLSLFVSCPGLQAVCDINVPNNIQPLNTLKLSKDVRQEDAVAVVLENVCCPVAEHLNNKSTIKDLHICFRWAVCSNVCSSVVADQLFLFPRTRFKLSSTDKIRKIFNGEGSSWQGQPSLHNQCCSLHLPGLLPHQHSQIQEGSVQDTSASLPFYLSAYHQACSMTVVLAGFRAWKILAGPLSLSGMQCKAANTTNNRCGGLPGKISEPSIVAQKHADHSFTDGFWLILFPFPAFPQQSCYIAASHWWWLS